MIMIHQQLYIFYTNLLDAKSLKMIKEVIEEYNDKTCLYFLKRTNEKKYIHIANVENEG